MHVGIHFLFHQLRQKGRNTTIVYEVSRICFRFVLVLAYSHAIQNSGKWASKFVLKLIRNGDTPLAHGAPNQVPHRRCGANKSSWNHFGLSCDHLGPSLGRAEPPLKHPGGFLVPTWPQLGPQNGTKIVQTSIHKAVKILMSLRVDFRTDFGPFWVPAWSTNST